MRRFRYALLLLSMAAGCHRAPVQETAPIAIDAEDVPITAADVDMPKTYAAGVERIRNYRDQIGDAISAGTPGKAHRPLDELGFVLEALPYLARDSGVPRRHWENLVLAAEDISELAGDVHAAIDNHRSPDYERVGPLIDEAIWRLANLEEKPFDPRALSASRVGSIPIQKVPGKE
ncbi:MAG TPA: hypothetical protein VG826_15970 [Pirellulales bacterium]|nr:hypothetical protein [Pirellulales bacterium]